MTYREAITELIQVLGQLYSDQASIRRIIIQVNLPIEQILFSGRADNTWADVLYKARRHNQVEDIFAVVLGEYPAVAELHTAVAGYREAVGRGDIPPLPLRRCDFYAHVSLPPNFVARPTLLHEVRDVILATPATALTSAIPMDALHGMGGIGKSVIARALCDDAEVQDAFSDGILWATVGQTPDLIARLREWIEELGGIIPQTAPTVNQLKQNLAELLTDRACLLILDDVWHRSNAEHFLVGGPRCRLLLTTRDSEVARGLGAGVHAVPAMDPDEAVDLLELWAGGALRQADTALKWQIVRRLGYLPLAIKLAGSQLQRKSPERWLAGFDATQLQERRVEKVHDSLARTLALSLDELEATERRLYATLAIFREDEAAPLPGIGKLWAGLAGYNEDQTVDLVQDLAARALLQITDSGPEGTPAAVTIHDLLRDFMGVELGEAGRLAAHRAIVEAYRRMQMGNGWSTAPDDGYLYDHLVYHLDKLADHQTWAVADLQSLFANDAWLQVRVSGAGYLYDSYLADLDVAWWRAHQETVRQIEAREVPAAFAECMRYALIRTSVNSLSSSYAPVLVAQAVETGLWSPQRAISVAIRISDPEMRARMFTAIIAMAGIQLSGEEKAYVIAQSLAAALAIQHEQSRVQALTALARQLSGEEKAYALAQGLAAAQTITHMGIRSQALAVLASQMSGEKKIETLRQGLAAAYVTEDEGSRAQALTTLAPQLSGELLAQGLAIAQTMESAEFYTSALIALATQLSGEEKMQALTQGMAVAPAIENAEARARALARLALQLSGKKRTQALAQSFAATQAIGYPPFRIEMLTALAPLLSQGNKVKALTQALADAQTIKDAEARARALANLAPQLSGKKRTQALAQSFAAVPAIEDALHRAQVLTALAQQISGQDRAKAIEQVLMTAKSIGDTTLRGRVLVALVSNLPGEEKTQVLAQSVAVAQVIEDAKDRVGALSALAPQLSEEGKAQALAQGLAAALAIQHEDYRSRALACLAPHLPADLLAQGLAAALAIQCAEHRAHALAALASQLSGEDKARAIEHGLAAALAIQDERYRSRALACLAPQLLGNLLAQGLAAALAIQRAEHRAHALAALASQLSGEDKARAIEHGLAAAQSITDVVERAEALAVLAPQLSGEEKAYAFSQGQAAVQIIKYDWRRARLLIALAPQVLEENKVQILAQALATVQLIRDEWHRAEALTTLTPQLSGELLMDGLAITETFKNERHREWVLTKFLPIVEDSEPLLRETRLSAAYHLWDNLKYQERQNLLSFCGGTGLFAPPIFTPHTLSRIAASIVEICWHWTWP